MATPTGGWHDPAQVAWYLDRIDRLEARRQGEQALVDSLAPTPAAVLDLGCGDGRLAALVMQSRPTVTRVIAIDRSQPMLAKARARFERAPHVTIVEHDLAYPLQSASADMTQFDLVVSGFAIHHLEDERKRSLFREIADALKPSGAFANLEVVASATPTRHREFLTAIGRDADDPEDRLAGVEAQLSWMRDAGLDDVDCLWRWRGFALLAGVKA